MANMLFPSLPSDPHIRPIHLRKDLNPIADLVELCFDDHMDEEGRAYLRNIRRLGGEGDPYYLDAGSPETSSIPFHGFVWVEEGKIIGNITLIYLHKREQNIYFIANVAVDPQYRGRGIGRQLTARALQHAREQNGRSVMLQVREDNPTAIHLYDSLGFYEMTRRTTWGFDHRPDEIIPSNGTTARISQRSNESWPQQRKWLEQLYPEKVTWFLPFQMTKHEPGLFNVINRWLNSESIRFWEAREDERLIGLASLEAINSFQDYLWLATSPAFEDTAIPALVASIGHRVRHPKRIQVNYPAHRAEAAFLSAGMVELNTLIWMEHNPEYNPGN
jgi:ribosomal protein S18 acetylase RimI-like enzyme